MAAATIGVVSFNGLLELLGRPWVEVLKSAKKEVGRWQTPVAMQVIGWPKLPCCICITVQVPPCPIKRDMPGSRSHRERHHHKFHPLSLSLPSLIWPMSLESQNVRCIGNLLTPTKVPRL